MRDATPVDRDRSTLGALGGTKFEPSPKHAKADRTEAPHLATLQTHDLVVRLVVAIVSEDPNRVIAWRDVIERHGGRADVASVDGDVQARSNRGHAEPRRCPFFAG